MRDRKSVIPMVDMSIPSIMMRPSAGSTYVWYMNIMSEMAGLIWKGSQIAVYS